MVTDKTNDTYQHPEEMYADNDLGTHPLFPGGFINFGYWDGLQFGKHIQLSSRINSQIELYNQVLSHLDIKPNSKLLEVGCGKGYGTMVALYDFGAKYVVGVDASIHQIQRSRNILKGNLVDRISFEVGLAEKLPFEDSSFDGIYSVEAIQHFKSYENFFKESFRVLKTGSKMSFCTFYAVNDNDVHFLKNEIQTYREGLDNVLVKTELEKGLLEAGFKNVEGQSIGKNVWEGFIAWSYQVRPKDRWDEVEKWLNAYKKGSLDYGIFTAYK